MVTFYLQIVCFHTSQIVQIHMILPIRGGVRGGPLW